MNDPVGSFTKNVHQPYWLAALTALSQTTPIKRSCESMSPKWAILFGICHLAPVGWIPANMPFTPPSACADVGFNRHFLVRPLILRML